MTDLLTERVRAIAEVIEVALDQAADAGKAVVVEGESLLDALRAALDGRDVGTSPEARSRRAKVVAASSTTVVVVGAPSVGRTRARLALGAAPPVPELPPAPPGASEPDPGPEDEGRHRTCWCAGPVTKPVCDRCGGDPGDA